MQSLSTNLIVTKSQNSVAVYGIPFSPLSYSVALPASTDKAIPIPAGTDTAVFHYSAGATVVVLEGLIGATNSLPTSTVTQTTQRINPPVCAVDAFDDGGNQLYLHLISPNPNDYVIVSFYFDGIIT
jgi:hypothetical protein